MRNLFDANAVTEIRARVEALTMRNERKWGRMNVAQAVAHCSGGFQLAMGEIRPPRASFPGRILGRIIKPLIFGDDKPMRRNSPTVDDILIRGERELDAERRRLLGMIDRFVDAGPAGCTRHAHSFFGRLTPQEWAILMYKHMDHHLRQFGG
ncbi:MAG: DUF1569 domain-containing protein [bacterium]